MAITITINGTTTLDESAGLQAPPVTATSTEDDNDNDVLLSTLQSNAAAFYSRLFNATGSGGLGLSTSFPSTNGVAQSASNFISVSGSGTITALGFVNGAGGVLPVYGGSDAGLVTGLSAADGGEIRLFQDSSLGGRMVLGVDATGDVVFAIFMQSNAALTSASVWMVQFEAMANPNTSSHDDPVNLFDSLGVAASASSEFDFSALPSGQNLFGIVGDAASGLVVIGKSPVLKADGTYANTSNTINTSQGGGPTTIGVNNQMFDPGEGAYFTFVKTPDPNFTSLALDANEADDADNIQFEQRLEVDGGFVKIAQIQGNSAASLKITTFNGDNTLDGRAFASTSASGGLGTGATVAITQIIVRNASGTIVQTINNPTADAQGGYTVSGLGAGFRVEWTTSGVHDQVLIEGVAGKFDIGGFGVNEPAAASVNIGDRLIFEDDGPSITASATSAPTLTVDETVLGTNATGNFAAQFSPVYGADGQAATPVGYALSTPGGAGGLVDTATGQSVVLSLNGSGQVEGRTATSGELVFTVSVSAVGVVTLDQIRAVVHPNAANPDDAKTLSAANLVVLTATATDKDGDSAPAPLNIGQQLVFEDDGPSITASATNAPTLTVDETVLATNATGNFAAQFSPVYGADGQAATPVGYALSTPGGASGLVDTATGQSVVLSLNGSGQVEGRTVTSGELVFTVSVSAVGVVTLDQIRAVVHPDAANPDDAKTLSAADLVVLTATATDKDGDSAAAPLNIGQQLVFEDDGPSITASATNAPTLTVDETVLATNATGNFAAQFSPVYGADGQAATPVGYALSTPGGASGLVDTATGQSVVLSLNGSGQVEGRTVTSGELVFTVSVSAVGVVTLDQIRAVVHPDAANPDDAKTLSAADLVVLTATATDKDGDSAAAPLNIGQQLVFEDDGPSITASATNAPTLTVDETVLATNATGNFAAQFSPVYGADGQAATPVGYALSTPGGASGLVDTATGQSVVLSLNGSGQVEGRTVTSGELVFTVSVSAVGVVTLDQIRAVVHPDAANPDDAKTLSAANLVVLTATATDKDGDSAAAPLNIGQQLVFEDDGPSITASATNALTLTVDETVLATNATGNFAAQFSPVYGADGQAATPVGYALSTPGGASGLVDTATGQSVVLSLNGSGQVEGRTVTSGELVFTVSVSAVGVVTLDQVRAVVHPNAANPDDAKTLSAANLVVLTATATDKDGDSAAAPLNIGQQLVFEDDGPSIGLISDGIVDFAANASVTKTLNGVVGSDSNTSPYALTSFTSGITINGVALQGVASGTTQVGYWADTNGDTIYGNTGDTEYYRLSLGDQSGAGSYTFTVLVNPPPAFIPFSFDALPSGQNLFGTVGDTNAALVVIGKTPVLNVDGTFTNTSNTINTSKGGGPTTIGVNNQMVDAGEGAYFTYIKSPAPSYLAGAVNGLDQNEADDADNILYSDANGATNDTIETSSAFLIISQVQGRDPASLSIKAFNMDGNPQGQSFVGALGTGPVITITQIVVRSSTDQVEQIITNPVANADGSYTVASLSTGDRVEWMTSALHDQVLISGVAGKFDIGGFGLTQGQATPDQLLEFTARVTDGDGDTAVDSWNVGIDGTGSFDDGVVSGVAPSLTLASLDFSFVESIDYTSDYLMM